MWSVRVGPPRWSSSSPQCLNDHWAICWAWSYCAWSAANSPECLNMATGCKDAPCSEGISSRVVFFAWCKDLFKTRTNNGFYFPLFMQSVWNIWVIIIIITSSFPTSLRCSCKVWITHMCWMFVISQNHWMPAHMCVHSCLFVFPSGMTDITRFLTN